MAEPHIYTPHNAFRAAADPNRCRHAVYEGRMGFYQCQRKPVVFRCVKGEDVGFCKQHDPEAVAAREKAWREKFDRERAAESAKWERARRLTEANRAAKEALEQIAAGHNDPRVLAAEILALFPADDLPTPIRSEGA
ncbi:hypothetical protein C0214_19800 [Methylobacterium sp. DM1]|nr:hypothetical protein C0214_19800 [Methylobacterium sp. DM1]